MNKQINAPLIAIFVAFIATSMADSGSDTSTKETKKMVQNNFVETAQKGIKLSGYVDAGYSYNFTGSGYHSNVQGRFGSDTAQRGDFNLYAVKLALEKAMTSENKAQAGFRTDVMIGEDANYFIYRAAGANNNTNNNSNALFLEQAYASIRAPVGNGWDFKVGKFVSILGYEVMERPANMNTTFGLLFNVMPLYYTGLLSSYRFDDYLEGKLGLVNGSNSDNNTTTSLDPGDGVAVLAALNVTAPGGNATWSNNFQYSTGCDNDTRQGSDLVTVTPEAAAAATHNESGYYLIYNSWGNWAPKFAEGKLLLAFNALLGNANGGISYQNNVPNWGTANLNACWYGAGAYAKYQFNDWFSLASRGEYMGSNNCWIFGNQGSAATIGLNNNHVTGDNLWEYTLTAGFNVIDNLLIRAEYRMDWGSNIYRTTTGGPAGAQSSGPAYYAGAEVVYSF